MNPVDLWGWLGTGLSVSFYVLLGTKRVRTAYAVACLAALVWTGVGVVLGLCSLIVKEAIICIVLVWGLYNWRRPE